MAQYPGRRTVQVLGGPDHGCYGELFYNCSRLIGANLLVMTRRYYDDVREERTFLSLVSFLHFARAPFFSSLF